jgi:hypothetical protein
MVFLSASPSLTGTSPDPSGSPVGCGNKLLIGITELRGSAGVCVSDASTMGQRVIFTLPSSCGLALHEVSGRAG